MSAWDDEDFGEEESTFGANVPNATFPVGDAWDDEDVEDEPDPQMAMAAPKPSAPMKPSKVRDLAIRKKEEEQARKAKEAALRKQKEMDELSPEERKARMEKMVKDSDLENARDLFMSGGSGAAIAKTQGGTIDTFEASTDEDYRKFAGMMGRRARELNTDRKRPARYVQFVKDLMKELTAELGPDDVREVSQYMTYISNQKRDEYKKAKGIGKKKGKKIAAVKVDREDQDFSVYDDEVYNDFM